MFQKRLSYLGVFFLTTLSLMPLRFLYLLADISYVLIYHVFGYRRKVVRQNLLNSFPEKNLKEIIAIEKEFFKYLTSLIFEVIKMRSISTKELNKRVKFKNVDLVEAYLKNNESVIFCSSHYGNYEWVCMAIGMTFSGQHHPIYKPLNNEIFDDWFLKMRSRYGNQMVSMRQTIRVIQSTKHYPTMFTFGSDQAPSKEDSQYWTTLLNQQASIQLGVEKIAKKTNRPVFYLKISYLKRGYYEVDCVPICLDPRNTAEFEITELHTRFLEDFIKEEPAYWLWSHRRWKYKPEKQVRKGLSKDHVAEPIDC
ncbi:lysophospholipid acyltransferase family protein [Pedobacter boryungensis]|uniref:Lysophospholipid acyltransferase family protein n=1 Tax=Pedobacter boryungensis TaxID=869962 RepID=A0ABX2DFU8_9SPHI|nr:lysophospholipid acyltransferase family protein [Pedobacter boryungensis]NQX32805.1 lysophospholipid acyltransferase family protein [Pedobacter boryungensis]